MFRKGQCVRSDLLGLGQVLEDGETPLIRFLDGRECRPTADSLSIVATEIFKQEILNHTLWNVFLTLRVYGAATLRQGGLPWVRGHDGIWTTPDELHREPPHPPGTMPYFLPDDIGEDARVISPDDLSDGREVVECTVTRVSGNGANGQSGRA